MFLLSISESEPGLDTMPVIKTIFYPWAEDSFKPLCYARSAVITGRGVLFDLQVFERDPVFHESDDILDDSCAALSFCFFPMKSQDVITVVLNAAREYRVYVNEKPFECALTITKYAGADEQGWYWGVRFILPSSLLLEVYDLTEIPNGHIMKGNIYKFKRTGNFSHIGAVAPMTEPFIFSSENLAEFKAVSY